VRHASVTSKRAAQATAKDGILKQTKIHIRFCRNNYAAIHTTSLPVLSRTVC